MTAPNIFTFFLKANITVLMNYAQPEASDAPPLDLTEFAAFNIAQPSVINHKDKDVRLLGACAIAEVLRISAPKPPYDNEQLKVSGIKIMSILKFWLSSVRSK